MSVIQRTYDLREVADDGFFATAINAPEEDCGCLELSDDDISTATQCPTEVFLQSLQDSIALVDSANVDVGALAECATDIKEFEKRVRNTSGYAFSIDSVTFSLPGSSVHDQAIFVQDCGFDCELIGGVPAYDIILRFTLTVPLLPVVPYTITATINAKKCGGFNPVTLVEDFVVLTFDLVD